MVSGSSDETVVVGAGIVVVLVEEDEGVGVVDVVLLASVFGTGVDGVKVVSSGISEGTLLLVVGGKVVSGSV